MRRTGVDYADYAVNLSMGCDGCELWCPEAGIRDCYAGRLTERWGGLKGWPESFNRPEVFKERFERLRRLPDLTGRERPDRPWLSGLPTVVFATDMGDPWAESLVGAGDEPTDWMLPPAAPSVDELPHVLLWLTKRPGMADAAIERNRDRTNGGGWPLTWALGTSVTTPATSSRIEVLKRIKEPGIILWVSVAPELAPEYWRMRFSDRQLAGLLRGINWVVYEGMSGPGCRPVDPDRARRWRDAAAAAGARFFMKQLGGPRPGGRLEDLPEDLRIREMPI